MLPQSQRLNGKDVMYLVKKRNLRHGANFSIYRQAQYNRNKSRQVSSHITPRIAKSSVTRHAIKRATMRYIAGWLKGKTGTPQKVFIMINKTKQEEIAQRLASMDKRSIPSFIMTCIEKDRQRFISSAKLDGFEKNHDGHDKLSKNTNQQNPSR